MITFQDKGQAEEYSIMMREQGFGAKIYKTGKDYKVKITSKSDKPIKLWHSTLSDYTESILEKGLVPRYKPPTGQTWLPLHKAIYFYEDKDTAIRQAEETNELEPDSIAVFEIGLPPTEEHLEKLKLGEEGEFIYEGTIEPQYIKRIL